MVMFVKNVSEHKDWVPHANGLPVAQQSKVHTKKAFMTSCLTL